MRERRTHSDEDETKLSETQSINALSFHEAIERFSMTTVFHSPSRITAFSVSQATVSLSLKLKCDEANFFSN